MLLPTLNLGTFRLLYAPILPVTLGTLCRSSNWQPRGWMIYPSQFQAAFNYNPLDLLRPKFNIQSPNALIYLPSLSHAHCRYLLSQSVLCPGCNVGEPIVVCSQVTLLAGPQIVQFRQPFTPRAGLRPCLRFKGLTVEEREALRPPHKTFSQIRVSCADTGLVPNLTMSLPFL